MPWPDFVTTQFNLVNRFTTDESEYYGPFNTFLTALFPPTENFQVVPQFKRIKGTVDIMIIFIITKRKVPVFFLDVKAHLALDRTYLRKEADDQMRDMFLDFSSGSLPLRKLYGISALGTRFSVYEYHPDTRRLTPRLILPDHNVVNDTAPRERWNYDLMTPEGEAKLKQIVGEIKVMAAALPGNCAHYSFLLALVLTHKLRVFLIILIKRPCRNVHVDCEWDHLVGTWQIACNAPTVYTVT
jgi:hypothetical protein